MWQNNGFENNVHFSDGFDQENYAPFPFPGTAGTHLTQMFFPQQLQPQDLTPYEDFDSYVAKHPEPDHGPVNDGSFVQNQFPNPRSKFSPPHFCTPPVSATTPRPATQINARAAELKAQLLRGRGRRSSSETPAVGRPGLDAQQVNPSEKEKWNSIRASPATPATASEGHEHELNINELISHYSELKHPADSSVKEGKNNSDSGVPSQPKLATVLTLPAKSLRLSLGSPTKVSMLASTGKGVVKSTPTEIGNGQPIINSQSEMSDGEILDDATLNDELTPTEPLQTQITVNKNIDEQNPRKARDDQKVIATNGHGTHEKLPSPKNTMILLSRNSDDQRQEDESRPDQKPYQTDRKPERKTSSMSDTRRYSYREVRDHNEDSREVETESEQTRQPTSRTNLEPAPPCLAEVIPHDDDLREWLEITGYHNEPYRSKILNRRRAIAALDAQREKLLAEMEAEERGGLLMAGTFQAAAPAAITLTTPNKVGDSADIASKPENSILEQQRNRVVSNKRSYSEIRDDGGDGTLGKMARVEDRGRGQRLKEEEQIDHRHSKSKGVETVRRPGHERHEESASAYFHSDEGRGRGRGYSHEPDMSPGPKAFESRPPARLRAYDSGSEDHYDREEGKERIRRPFEVRGGYRGRAFDPNYRGRGRGRGRGDWSGSQEQKSDTIFGSRIANSKPYKEPRGFDRGDKGDTRYFLVKSFNEENVLRCIADSTWTTQVQNGSIFKRAFETCKNVILVFSINKSRAFQGYARMESVPGSIEVPAWQKGINWESTGAFKVRWLVVCSTRFSHVNHLKNRLNDNQPVLVGKDGQEIEERCGAAVIDIITEEAEHALAVPWKFGDDKPPWEHIDAPAMRGSIHR